MQRLVVDARMILSSGIGRYIRASLAALAEKGTELTLLGDPAAIRTACPSLDFEVRKFDIPIYDPREQLALSKVVPPCEVFFSPHMTTTRFRVRACERVLTVHDAFHLSELADFSLAKRVYSRFMYRSAMVVSDRVISVSHFTREELSRIFPAFAGKIKVVPNFIDKGTFYPDFEMPTTMTGEYILFVGNMKPHKNLAVAIEAVRRLEPGLRLAVVGAESGFRHGLGKELERFRAMDHIAFLGQVDDAELRRLYSHASCFVFPSLYEGFGYPPLEAMACGCPVVCSDIPALRETCESAAEFRDPSSPDDFAEGLWEASVSGSTREALIEKGFERAEAFSRAKFESGIRTAIWGGVC